MADSWDDEDFEPVVLNAAAPIAAPADEESDGGNWDDDDFDPSALVNKVSLAPKNDDEEEEEDLVYEELNKSVAAKGSSAVNEAELRKQKAAEEELLKKARNGGLEETAEQKRIRERKQQEESDLAQAADAFSGFTVDTKAVEQEKKQTPQAFEQLTKGIGSVLLKTKQDHVNFGVNTKLKLLASKPAHVAAFYVAVFDVLTGSSYTLQLLTPLLEEVKKAHEQVLKSEMRRNFVPVRNAPTTTTAAPAASLDDDFYGDDDDGFGDDMGVSTSAASNAQKETDEQQQERVDEELRKQHAQYGTAIVLKFARSTPQNVVTFFSSFAKILQEVDFDSLDLSDILKALQAIHGAREKVEAKQPKVKTAKDLNKEKADKLKRHQDIFGDSQFDDSYGDYTALEDKYNSARDELW